MNNILLDIEFEKAVRLLALHMPPPFLTSNIQKYNGKVTLPTPPLFSVRIIIWRIRQAA